MYNVGQFRSILCWTVQVYMLENPDPYGPISPLDISELPPDCGYSESPRERRVPESPGDVTGDVPVAPVVLALSFGLS